MAKKENCLWQKSYVFILIWKPTWDNEVEVEVFFFRFDLVDSVYSIDVYVTHRIVEDNKKCKHLKILHFLVLIDNNQQFSLSQYKVWRNSTEDQRRGKDLGWKNGRV